MIFNSRRIENNPRSTHILRHEISMLFFIFIITIGLFSPSILWASTVKTDIIHSQDQYQPGGFFPILFHLKISSPWYIHGSADKGQGLIPTKLSFDDLKNTRVEDIKFPSPAKKKFDYTSEAIDVYTDEILVRAMLWIHEKANVGKYIISGNLSYQACSSKVCLPPETIPVKITVQVVLQGTPVKSINQAQFEALKKSKDRALDLPFSRLSAGFWFALLAIFVGGLALNLTPCIYPLIPITVSYFGGKSENIKNQTIFHGILYLLGLATTNSILGVSAALSGGMLGAALQNPGVIIFITGIMVALAFSFFGFWEIRVPAVLSKIASKNYKGYFCTFFIGLTLGIMAAPCIGPFVLGLLTYVGQMGDPFLGFLYFFTLSIGMGLPLCILAIFSGNLDRLPRSGDWMIWVKRLMGWVLIGAAAYFIKPLIPYPALNSVLLPIIFIIAGIQVAWLDKTGLGFSKFLYFKKIVGTFIALMGLVCLISAFQPKEEVLWQPYREENISKAIEEKKPIILDVYADWCLPCKELDARVFRDQEVVQLSKHFAMLRLDLTNRHPQQDEILHQYQIRGVPTMLFFNNKGIEEKALRIESIVSSREFLNKMEALWKNEPAPLP